MAFRNFWLILYGFLYGHTEKYKWKCMDLLDKMRRVFFKKWFDVHGVLCRVLIRLMFKKWFEMNCLACDFILL